MVRSLGAGCRGDLPEVVFLAGLGAPGYLAPWARDSSRWTRTTVVDLPGWRAGRAHGCAPTLNAVARATARWLEVTDRNGIILLGHSTGAQAVLMAALQVADRISGLVLAGPTFDPTIRSMPALARRAARTIRREPAGELGAVVPSYVASGGRPLMRFIRSATSDRPEDRVAGLSMPSVVITGEHDGFAPPSWAERLAALADAPCVILPGAHNACFPHARDADAALRGFAGSLHGDTAGRAA